MSEDSSSLIVDRSDHYLIGLPVEVSIALSEATWAALTHRTTALYSTGENHQLPLQDRVELFIDDLIYERVVRDGDGADFDDDDYDPPF